MKNPVGRRGIVILLLASCSLPVMGQDASSWEVHLQQSISDKNSATKPAAFQLTFPGKGENSYAVDLGLTALRPSDFGRAQWDWGVAAEYHHNTLLDRKQDTREIGFTALGEYGDPATIAWLPQVIAKYKYDGVKSTGSLVPSASMTLTNFASAIGFAKGGPGFKFFWQPTLGVELEDGVKAPSAKPTGQVSRAFGHLEAALYPAAELLKNRLEIVPGVTLWQDFAKSKQLGIARDRHVLRTISVNYYLGSDQMFSLGLDYVNGEDPSQGLPEQRYTRIAFKVAYPPPNG